MRPRYKTAGLLVFVAVVGGRHLLSWPPRRPEAWTVSRRVARCPACMAHSLIPIVIGYVFAHYLDLSGREGPADRATPFDRDRHDAQVYYLLSMHPSVLASAEGRVRAPRACRGGGGRARPGTAGAAASGHQMTGQLAMMLVMVGYTFTGLYLLFGG